MAYYQALGTGPVSFLDGHSNQIEIPLSEVFFTPNGVDASAWPLLSSANQTFVAALLEQMISQGVIKASALPAAAPSMTVTAAQAGAMGDSITVEFTSPSPTAGTVTVTVATKQVYKGLTPATLGTVLGTSAGTASGLVYLSSDDTKVEMPEQSSGPVGATFALDVPQAADNTQTAFTLTAASQDPAADAATIQILIEPDTSAVPPTEFTLTVSWTKSAAAITLGSLASVNPFKYLVSFSGQSGPLPVASKVALQGGTPAKAASATLLASS